MTEIKEEEEEEDGILVKVMPLTESSIFSCLSMFYDSFLVEQRQQVFSVTDQVQTVQSVWLSVSQLELEVDEPCSQGRR